MGRVYLASGRKPPGTKCGYPTAGRVGVAGCVSLQSEPTPRRIGKLVESLQSMMPAEWESAARGGKEGLRRLPGNEITRDEANDAGTQSRAVRSGA